jgi:cysteine desulfurase
MYFDHNATTPLLPAARQAWLDATEQFIGNPSSPHRIGARAEIALNAAREKLAAFLDCGPLEIIWTSGATESNNTVLHHLAQSLGNEAEIWISATEHPCVLSGARHYFPGRHRLIPVRRSGVVDLDWLETNLRASRPGAVSALA